MCENPSIPVVHSMCNTIKLDLKIILICTLYQLWMAMILNQSKLEIQKAAYFSQQEPSAKAAVLAYALQQRKMVYFMN